MTRACLPVCSTRRRQDRRAGRTGDEHGAFHSSHRKLQQLPSTTVLLPTAALATTTGSAWPSFNLYSGRRHVTVAQMLLSLASTSYALVVRKSAVCLTKLLAPTNNQIGYCSTPCLLF